MRVFDGGRYQLYDTIGYEKKGGGALTMECAARFCAEAGVPCPPEASLARTPRGKPYFNLPGAPSFSVSHSGGLWGCAFSSDQIGFDVERAQQRDWAAVAKRFFHPVERDMALSGGEEAFFLLWTAKESYVKYLGIGIDESFASFCLVNNGKISGKALGVAFGRPPVPEGYFSCVCMKEELSASLRLHPSDSRKPVHSRL